MDLRELVRRASHLAVGEVTRDIEVGPLRLIEVKTLRGAAGAQVGQPFTYLERPRPRTEFPGERIGTTELVFLKALHDREVTPSLMKTLRRYGMDASLVCRLAAPDEARWLVERQRNPWLAIPPARVALPRPIFRGGHGVSVDMLLPQIDALRRAGGR